LILQAAIYFRKLEPTYLAQDLAVKTVVTFDKDQKEI
jgi:hypothetical protein